MASYNCQNFKANYNFIIKLLEKNEFVYLCETWLATEEEHIINEIISDEYQFISQSNFSLANNRKGRPFGGKIFIIKKIHKLISCTTLSSEIDKVCIALSNGKRIHIYCLWLAFDNNSSEAFNSFKSNLEILETEIAYNRREQIEYFFLGDFNADQFRGKRFDKCFVQFLNNNKVNTLDDIANRKSADYTYKNGHYTAYIDHMVCDVELFKNSKINYNIVIDLLGCSQYFLL